MMNDIEVMPYTKALMQARVGALLGALLGLVNLGLLIVVIFQIF